MRIYLAIGLSLSIFFYGCSQTRENLEFEKILGDTPSISGKQAYLSSPFVTAGDRVYMVGHQNGTFPELGWHIKGEMGGIWNHPIKLMDGFDIRLIWPTESFSLDSAHTFVNYPLANSHEYSIPEKNLKIKRWQFVPDGKEGLLVQYQMENTGETDQIFTLVFTGHTDLRPTWLGERTQMFDAKDSAEYSNKLDAWSVKDRENPWYLLFGADRNSTDHPQTEKEYSGLGVSNNLNYAMDIPARTTITITFAIAGSYNSQEECRTTYEDLHRNASAYLISKKERYRKIAGRSKLTIPDKDLEEAFKWLKYNCDWLVQTVPEIGTGITAGIPDYPWWFGVDSEYALKGYMAIGQTDAVYATIALLDSVSNAVNGNGKIIHEMSTNGAVFNDGNINETPQFASLIWETYLWNGNTEFLEKYFPTIKKGMEWLITENDADDNGFPDGFGMMEIHGLDSEMIDVAAYTQRAFADASKIAKELGDEKLAQSYLKKAIDLKRKINTEFWSEKFNSYADFIGTDTQALRLIEDAIVRADTLNKPWAVAELEQTKKRILAEPSNQPRPFVVHHNWVVNTPMEMQIADSTKAIKALNTAKNFVNPFGMFVTGIDRDASAGSDDGSFKGSKVFSYTGAVMTLPTGVQAIAENNYGRPDRALDYLQRMTRTFSYALPGSIYEVSPDYGMMAQAWNIYSYAIPIVQQFFGIRPKASEKKISIRPQMPQEWDKASLENVKVADNSVSVYYEKTGRDLSIKVKQIDPSWKIEVLLPKEKDAIYKTSPNKASHTISDKALFSTKGSELNVEVKRP